jgi:hypothetical protein
MATSEFRWEENPEAGAFVVENYSSMHSPQIAEQIGARWGVHVSPGAVRGYFRHYQVRQKLAAEQGQGEYPAPAIVAGPGEVHPDQRAPLTEAEIADLYTATAEAIERKEAMRRGQTTLTVDFSKERLPVGLCFWADWQLGSNGVLMRKLEEDARAIRDTEGLEVFVLGDLIQNLNVKKHPQSLHECVLPDPRDQAYCAKYILNIVKPKIHGLVDGNHEFNAKQAAGLVPTEDWCSELGVPYLWHGAVVNWKQGEQEYSLGLRHKFRGESGLNTTNVQRTMYEQWHAADVEVLGHRHYPDMQKRPKPGRDTVWLRTGTYQNIDEHGMYSGGYMGKWGIASIILFPDRKCVLPFYGGDFYTMLEVLADQRRRYRERLHL